MAGHNVLFWGSYIALPGTDYQPQLPFEGRNAAALVAALILHGLCAIGYGLETFFMFSSFVPRYIKKVRKS